MRYARLIDGNPVYATNPLRIGTRHVYTTDPTKYGYKPVNDTPPIRDGYVAVPTDWVETDTEIARTWEWEVDNASADNHPVGELFEQGGVTYRATSPIARGERIDGTNATPVDVAQVLNDLETKE